MDFDNNSVSTEPQNGSLPNPVTVISEEVRRRLALKEMALSAMHSGILITDPNLTDNPIIYANYGFSRLTGYPRQEVLGLNCRFLQGADTDRSTVDVVRNAIREGSACSVVLLNYKKDGSTFWSQLEIYPVRENEDPEGRLLYFVGVQNDVTERKNAQEHLEELNRQLMETIEDMKKGA